MTTSLFNLRNGLIALAIVLAIGLGFETDWGAGLMSQTPTPRNVAGKHEMASVLPDFRLGSEAGTYSQIVEKPLLNPSRKPAPTQAVVAATEPPKPQIRRGLYQLVGVTDLGSVKIAQVREIASNRIRSVREGDQLQELTVKKVSASQLVLAFQSDTDVVELPKFTASGRVPQPAPPPPPPTPVAATSPAPAPSPQQPPQPQQVAATAPAAGVSATGAPSGERNAMLSATPLPNGQPYTAANADAFIEARRRARFGQ